MNATIIYLWFLLLVAVPIGGWIACFQRWRETA